MLTATLPISHVSVPPVVSRNETGLSDSEISQRVLKIRSGWSVAERVERRREAERRFASLVEALSDACPAA